MKTVDNKIFLTKGEWEKLNSDFISLLSLTPRNDIAIEGYQLSEDEDDLNKLDSPDMVLYASDCFCLYINQDRPGNDIYAFSICDGLKDLGWDKMECVKCKFGYVYKFY
jgi:hypothetical protein